MGFDERILNGMGVLTAIVDSGTFAAARAFSSSLVSSVSPSARSQRLLVPE